MTHFPDGKPSRLLAALAVLAALILGVFTEGCKRDEGRSLDARQFTVRGIIRGISPDRGSLDVQHEEIPGYMPSMTMPFALKNPQEAGELKVGDGISFRLVVDDKEATIDRVTKIPSDQVRVVSTAAVPSTVASGPARVKEGDPLPTFSLTNQDGATITPESFRDQPLVLTFIFTRCPVPNFCPLMSRNFLRLQEAIHSAGGESLGKTRLLSISFDPEHDTAKVLKDYAASEGADPAIWSLATGTPGQIAELTRQFAVFVQPESGTINHGLTTALVTAQGKIQKIWRGNSWSPEEVLREIEALESRPQ